MEEHHNGVNSTEELETLIGDYGVLFREYRGDGFMVVGENNIFIVKDHEDNGSNNTTNEDGVEFSEINAEHIHELHAEEVYPKHRLEIQADAEKVDNGNQAPCTEIKLWVASHSIQFYADSPVHKVAASFVNF